MSDNKPCFAELLKLAPEHDLLKKFVGEWETKTTFFFKPNTPGQGSTGLFKYSLVLGGRYVEGHYKSNDSHFEGRDFFGFDASRKEYHTTWFDAMSNVPMASRGNLSGDSKKMVMKGVFDEILTNTRDAPFRTETEFVSDDEMVYRMFKKMEGQEFCTLEVHSHRKK